MKRIQIEFAEKETNSNTPVNKVETIDNASATIYDSGVVVTENQEAQIVTTFIPSYRIVKVVSIESKPEFPQKVKYWCDKETNHTFSDKTLTHLTKDEYIQAIKQIREETNFGLKEAKQIVDRYRGISIDY